MLALNTLTNNHEMQVNVPYSNVVSEKDIEKAKDLVVKWAETESLLQQLEVDKKQVLVELKEVLGVYSYVTLQGSKKTIKSFLRTALRKDELFNKMNDVKSGYSKRQTKDEVYKDAEKKLRTLDRLLDRYFDRLLNDMGKIDPTKEVLCTQSQSDMDIAKNINDISEVGLEDNTNVLQTRPMEDRITQRKRRVDDDMRECDSPRVGFTHACREVNTDVSVMTCAKKDFTDNQNKLFVNHHFAQLVIQAFLGSRHPSWFNSFVGVLDSVERNTCETFLSYGVPKDSLLIVEMDPTVAQIHTNAGFATTHEGTLTDFASDDYDDLYHEEGRAWRVYSCRGFYFDTCGTISTQKKGIFDTILKLQLISQSILGFTFTKRSTIQGAKYEEERNLFNSELSLLLRKKGFQMCLKLEHAYSGDCLFEKSPGAAMDTFIVCCV